MSQTVGPTDSQLARGQGSEVPLGSLAGVPVEFKISLRPWTLSRAFGLLPSDGLPVYHQTGSARCAQTPDPELCLCCSALWQDHRSSSSLDHDLAAVR